MQREQLWAEVRHEVYRQTPPLLSPLAYIRIVNRDTAFDHQEQVEQDWRMTQGQGVQDPNGVDQGRRRHRSRILPARSTTVRRVTDYYRNHV